MNAPHRRTQGGSIVGPGARGEDEARAASNPGVGGPVLLHVIDWLARLRPEEGGECLEDGGFALRSRSRTPFPRGVAFDQPIKHAGSPFRWRIVEDAVEDTARIDTTDETIEVGLPPE